MHIARISTMNFYGTKTTIVKDATKNANKKADQLLEKTFKPADDFVNYEQSAYSVPTGEFPAKQKIKRYPFNPEDNVITKEYFKIKENKPEKEEVVDFVSDGSIL